KEDFPDLSTQPFASPVTVKLPGGFWLVEAPAAGEHQPDDAFRFAQREMDGKLAAEGIAHDHNTSGLLGSNQRNEKLKEMFNGIRRRAPAENRQFRHEHTTTHRHGFRAGTPVFRAAKKAMQHQHDGIFDASHQI